MEEAEKSAMEAQLAEAEERGYKRGLNEQLEQLMAKPGQWESSQKPAEEPQGYEILSGMRPGMWD